MSLTNQLGDALRWVPDKLIQRVPSLAALRRRTAVEHARIALDAYQGKQTNVAIAELTKAAELEPRVPEYVYDLGRIHYEQKSLVEAEKCFRRALNIDFSYPLALKGLGYTLHLQANLDEAIYLYLRYLEKSPADADVQANLVAALEAGGKYDEAISAAEKAIKNIPSNPELLLMLARNNYLAGKNNAAISHLKRAREIDPKNPEIHRLLGVALDTAGKNHEALDSFKAAIGRDAANASAYLSMSRIYERLNQNEEYLDAASTARELFQATGNNDGLKSAYWDEGWALYKLRRWQESVKASESALDIDPTLATVRFNLGIALLRLGEVARAKDEYQMAIELNDVGALKTAGITDLSAALEDEPKLPGAREILDSLNEKYRQVTQVRDDKIAARSKDVRDMTKV